MLTTAENFAAAEILTEWPDNMNYDQLLDGIIDGHPDVIVCETYENHLPDDVVEAIEGLRVSFLNSVRLMAADLFTAIEDGDPQTIADRMISLRNQLGE